MSETQFVKAYCPVSKQYYGMMLVERAGHREVVDFYDLTNEQASLVFSTTDQTRLSTAENLRPCFVC